MKKIAILLSAATAPFLTASKVFAQPIQQPAPQSGSINIIPPAQGFKTLGDFVGNILTLAFVIALLVALAMLIWGAFEWITSGGDKEAVGKARSRIINALIGLAVLAIAFAIARVAATFLGFPDIRVIPIPTPNPLAPGT